MKKQIKKLLATTLVATTLLGCSMNACAYDLPYSTNTMLPKKYTFNDLSLVATPISYETSKYPEIDLRYTWLQSSSSISNVNREDEYILNLNYTNVPKNLYYSGNILLGAKMHDFEMRSDTNSMACIKLNGIDIKNTYVATYDVGVKPLFKKWDITYYDYDAIVRLEPSYSVFANDVEIEVIHNYNVCLDQFIVYAKFTVANKLLMDGFEIVVDASPNVNRSTTGRRTSGIRAAKFVGEANVTSYTGEDPLSDEELSTEGYVLLYASDNTPYPKTLLDGQKFDVFFNGIKVADDITIDNSDRYYVIK